MDSADEKIAALETELQQTRLDAANVVHALDCAVQLVEALIRWLPEGMELSTDVKARKESLDRAMRIITGRDRLGEQLERTEAQRRPAQRGPEGTDG